MKKTISTAAVETLLKEIDNLETCMDGIRKNLEVQISDLLLLPGPIAAEELDKILAKYDASREYLKTYITDLTGFQRAAARQPGLASEDLIQQITAARQKIMMLDNEMAWFAEHLQSRVAFHNATLGKRFEVPIPTFDWKPNCSED